jgi:flagellin-like hook-associated protein FlgL
MKKILLKNTTAAESQIRDTDMAKEMVFYTNQNILARREVLCWYRQIR